MEEKTPDLRLMEPASPESLLPDAGFPWPILIVATLIIIAIVAFLVIKRKNPAIFADPRKLRDAAFARSRAALRSINAGNAREAAVQASLIVRHFLAEAARDPALFETHEEFITRRDSLRQLTDSARESGGKGFTWLANLKYAPQPPDLEPQRVIDEADSLLEVLHLGFQS